MKFQFLGTSAAEGIPALWCNCEHCKRSREIGGRAIRTRSQAIIDGRLLIDFPPDTNAHILREGIDLLNIRHCLITHSHKDHLYPTEFYHIRPGYSHLPEGYKLTICGSEKMSEKLLPIIKPTGDEHGCIEFCALTAYKQAAVGDYTVTPLRSVHDQSAGPLFYQISDGEKTILYGHDTHFFSDEVWQFWRETKPHFDFVSLDCNNSCLPLDFVGHMNLEANIKVRAQMLEMGIADEHTIFVCNHFSHNGRHVVYDEFVPIAAKEGFLVSYDGMKITI